MGADRGCAQALAPDVVVGVIGAGAMGAGIAQVACVAGHPVRIFDTREGAAARVIDSIAAALEKLVAKGRLAREQSSAARERLYAAQTLGEFAGCGLCIEAIVEQLDAKRELFRRMEEVVSADALLASNTSSLSITAIAADMQRPERFAGLHFFNPAPLMPLVEVVSGAATSAQTATTLHATATAWGKSPVYARSTPGFIVNRVARPFYAEALRVLNERAADCATIDAVMREAGGFRMGPFELMDLIGNDVNYSVTHSVFEAFYGDPRFTPSLLQLELVQAGYLGRKSGRGFYDYAAGAAPPKPRTSTPAPSVAAARLFGSGELTERLAIIGADIERREAAPDGRIAECGECVLYESDGRTATARAAATGVANTLLVDLTFDPATCIRVAVSAADQADSAAVKQGIGLLQTAGIAVSQLDDVAGLIVLRTVAMLANEAADAVNQGVCSAADCDLAMRKGVNYPRGPLAWADELGAARIVAALDHLAQAYGEDRYRVSPLLRRKAITGGRFHQNAQEDTKQ